MLAILLLAACDDALLRRRQEHVLNRIGYGPDPWSLARIRELGLRGYVEEQLQPETLDDAALEAELAARYPTLSMQFGGLRSQYSVYSLDPAYAVTVPRQQLSYARVLRAVHSKRQLREVLVDFWFNHFNVDGSIGHARWGVVPYERDAIRPHVLGRFEDMLLATAQQPAMLDYLDNDENFKEGFVYLNRVRGANENYARELLELHTVGVDGGYVHDDILAVARAFTGWTIPVASLSSDNGFKYLDSGHDKDAKSVMNALYLAPGGDRSDGEAVIDFLARQPATAERMSRKLCQRFVAEVPPESLVQQAKQVFLDTDGDLREVTATILLSSEFLQGAGYRSKTKRPLVFLASLARAVGVGDDVAFARIAESELRLLGEELYAQGPPTGYPETSAFWRGEGAFVRRVNLAYRAAIGEPAYSFAPSFGATATSPAEIVAQLRAKLLRGELESTTSGELVALAEATPASARVAETAAALLASPEFLIH